MAKQTAARAHDFTRIDVHTHSWPFEDATKIKGSAAAYVKKIRAAGIDKVVLMAPADCCLKAVKKYGDFVIPVAMYYMREFGRRDFRGEMERALDGGCKAIKFIAPLAPYSDERYWPLYDMIDHRGAVAMFHTGYLGFDEKQPEIPPIEMTHMRAAHIDAIGRRFPRLKIEMSHFSNPWWEEAWKVAWSRPNVYADLSGGTAINRAISMWAEMFAPHGVLMESALKKVCFASDVNYFHDGDHDFGAHIDFHERLLDRINAPAELRELVWSGNARKLFGLK